MTSIKDQALFSTRWSLDDAELDLEEQVERMKAESFYFQKEPEQTFIFKEENNIQISPSEQSIPEDLPAIPAGVANNLRACQLQLQMKKGTNVPKFIIKEFKNYFLSDQCPPQYKQFLRSLPEEHRQSVKKGTLPELRALCEQPLNRFFMKQALSAHSGEQTRWLRSESSFSYQLFRLKFLLRLHSRAFGALQIK